MASLTITCPDEVLAALRTSPQAFEKEARVLLSMKLFELGKLSSGQAARLAGLERTAFLQEAGKYGVSLFRLTEGDLQRDLQDASNSDQ